MGLILGALAIAAGVIGLKYSIAAIVVGITAVTTFFKVRMKG